MITKINELKTKTPIPNVKRLCESTISAISSAIYNGVTSDAQTEIENIALTNLFNGLEKYSNNKYIREWLDTQKRIYTIKNIGVRHAVNRIMEREGRTHPTLEIILEDFKDKLNQDVHESLLYEEFISAMSGFNYLSAVDTELSALKKRISNYKNDIDITKIIETMKQTRSNYLIPLIEDVVNNYLINKTEQAKSSLKETLIKFSYDNFIREILNAVMLDATQLQLEYANSGCDISEKIFSPILYLGENEVLFNVKGSYYIKKGNFINKVKSEDYSKINKKFKYLCESISGPNVEINKKYIKIFIGNDNAVLMENETYINGKAFSNKQITESLTSAAWANNRQIYEYVTLLRENFNEIAELDFVKRVFLKENENYAADIFKLRDNIFITTHDPINSKITFYRNINPIQADKIMMEHMRYDISKAFKDILPNKDKILSKINETKKEYTTYILELESKIKGLKNNWDNSISNEVLNILNEELNNTKNDYKNYLNKIQKYIDVNENLNVTVQDTTSGKSYTVIVPTGDMAAKGERGSGNMNFGADTTQYGSEVGASNIRGTDTDDENFVSAITFDDDESELLSDQPTSSMDGENDIDDIEAYADKIDAEAELKKPKQQPGNDNLGDTDQDDTQELDLGLGDEDDESGDLEDTEETKETTGAPNKEVEKNAFNKNKNPNDLNKSKSKKVFLKRKI